MSRVPSQDARSSYQQGMPEQEPAGPSSSAERTRACRERLKAAGRDRAERPPCLLCGRLITLGSIDPDSIRGQSRTGLVLCAPCWRKSDEGKASERARNEQRRQRRRQLARCMDACIGAVLTPMPSPGSALVEDSTGGSMGVGLGLSLA